MTYRPLAVAAIAALAFACQKDPPPQSEPAAEKQTEKAPTAAKEEPAKKEAAKPEMEGEKTAASTLLAEGADAPDIEAVAHNGEKVKLSDLKGKTVVVYFYPKDDTPGCTIEAKEIRDDWDKFKSAQTVVLGVSTDGNDSHQAFAKKYDLPFLLLPDEDESIAKAFGVPVTSGYAKRVTFVIDTEGKIGKVFPQVNPQGHAEELMQAIEALNS